ncbi:MAG: SMC-Scp complex subunit ScpB [Planctomycetota bacterium]|nr:SMC-Scp complex subunit ScpB [Planctomycetota bacterium]
MDSMDANAPEIEETSLVETGSDAEHAGQGEEPQEAQGSSDGSLEKEAQDAPEGEAPDGAEEEEEESNPKLGPGEELDDDELVRRLAALLFVTVEPLTLGKLVKLLERPRKGRVKDALITLEQRLEAADLPMQVRSIKGGYGLMTAPEMGQVVQGLLSGPPVERVSAAALETLAVVAYRQPVTKAEIEAIRGVQAGPILRSLVDRGLVRVSGRADVPGNPLEYGTTKDFLDRFGLQNVQDLPRDAELARD